MKPLPRSFYAATRDRLRRRAEAAGLDGLLLLAPGNVTYATGFHYTVNERPTGVYLPVDGDPILFVALLDKENAEVIPGITVETYEEYPGPIPAELWMIERAGARRFGIDSLEARFLAAAQDRLGHLDLTDHALPERAVKQPEELALTRAAAGFADICLRRLLERAADIIAQGGTEQDLMADCTGHARAALMAAHGEAFQGTKLGITASVHSGPRAALPHGSVLPRRPQPGEPLIAGIGASLGGYHSESGITLMVGEITADQRRAMTAMAEANQATRAALTERQSCEAVNAAALGEIRKAGFGEAIRHRIGHGMGVEGHEAPWLAPGDETPTAPGMVFSCEPGIYRPGHDGYRTIETLIVTDTGVETASRFQSETPFDARVLPV